MIIDKRLEFSAQQALTASAVSTNVIDLGAASRNIGPGEPMWVVVMARAAQGGTSPTFAASIQTDDNEAFSSARTLSTSETKAAMAAGDMIVLPMTFENERYLRLNYTLAGTSPTANVDAFLTNQDPKSWTALPDAI